MAKTVQLGSHVILRDIEGSQRVIQVPEEIDSKIKFMKMTIPTSVMHQVPYGSTYRLEGGRWERRKPITLANEDVAGETENTNADLAQNNTAQKLSTEEIIKMKASNQLSGEELIKTIVANSASFEGKTTFSQQKYIAKKQKKHIQQITIMEPRLVDVCDTHFLDRFMPTMALRFDYLSSLLHQSGCGIATRTGQPRVMVWDDTCGLVTAAILQRCGGRGYVFRTHNQSYKDKIIRELDLPENFVSSLHTLPIEFLLQYARTSEVERQPEGDESEDPRWWKDCEYLREPVLLPETATKVCRALIEERHANRTIRWKAQTKKWRIFEEDLMDSLVGAIIEESTMDQWIEGVLPLLRAGGQVCVYVQDFQLAFKFYKRLKSGDKDNCENAAFIFVKMQEFFLREFCTLPQRTHPLMNQTSTLFSGFLVSATRTNAPLATMSPDSPERPRKRSASPNKEDSIKRTRSSSPDPQSNQ